MNGRPRPSLRAAIDRKCKDCTYDPMAPGNWRQQVQACTVTTCPLHPVRPQSRGTRAEEDLTREE